MEKGSLFSGGTVLEGVKEAVKDIDSSQLHEYIQDTQVAIKTENNPTHSLEASPPSPQFQADETPCVEAPIRSNLFFPKYTR